MDPCGRKGLAQALPGGFPKRSTQATAPQRQVHVPSGGGGLDDKGDPNKRSRPAEAASEESWQHSHKRTIYSKQVRDHVGTRSEGLWPKASRMTQPAPCHSTKPGISSCSTALIPACLPACVLALPVDVVCCAHSHSTSWPAPVFFFFSPPAHAHVRDRGTESSSGVDVDKNQ